MQRIMEMNNIELWKFKSKNAMDGLFPVMPNYKVQAKAFQQDAAMHWLKPNKI